MPSPKPCTVANGRARHPPRVKKGQRRLWPGAAPADNSGALQPQLTCSQTAGQYSDGVRYHFDVFGPRASRVEPSGEPARSSLSA